MFTSVSYEDFTLTGAYASRTKHIPTAPFGSFFGAGHAETSDRREYLDLKYDHLFEKDTEVSGRVSYDAFPHLGKYPYDYGVNNQPADIAIDYDGDYGSWLTSEVQVKQRLSRPPYDRRRRRTIGKTCSSISSTTTATIRHSSRIGERAEALEPTGRPSSSFARI